MENYYAKYCLSETFRAITVLLYLLLLLLCSGIRTMIAYPYNEVVRIEQPRFQPQTVANLSLDYGLSYSFFNPNDAVRMSMTRDDINRVWSRYNTNTTYG